MDNQNTTEQTQTTTPISPNIQEPPSITPSEPPKKKTNVPLIIVSILALCFAGLAIFFGIQYFMPKKETPPEPEQTSTTSTDDQPTPTPAPATPTMAEEYKEVYNEMSTLTNTISDNNSTYIQNDSGLTYKPEGFNTYLPMRFNLITKITDSNGTNISSLQNQFETLNYTSLGIIPFLGSAGPTIYGYYNSEKDIVCGYFNEGSFTNPNDPNDGYYYTQLECAKPSWVWLSEEEENTLKELETAYYNKTGEYPTTLQTNIVIKDSPNAPYQTLQTGVGGGVGLFYRTSKDADWQFLKGTQVALSCDEYNTEDLKKAYQGTICYDGQTESTVQP